MNTIRKLRSSGFGTSHSKYCTSAIYTCVLHSVGDPTQGRARGHRSEGTLERCASACPSEAMGRLCWPGHQPGAPRPPLPPGQGEGLGRGQPQASLSCPQECVSRVWGLRLAGPFSPLSLSLGLWRGQETPRVQDGGRRGPLLKRSIFFLSALCGNLSSDFYGFF